MAGSSGLPACVGHILTLAGRILGKNFNTQSYSNVTGYFISRKIKILSVRNLLIVNCEISRSPSA